MRIIIAFLILSISSLLSGQSAEAAIKEQAVLFSQYVVNGEYDKVIGMYTSDAKIFPTGRDILEGDDLAQYWTPVEGSEWRTVHHKLTAVEIKVYGDEAYDYGYFEGISTNGDEESKWRGKYVVIWRREGDVWRMYLDIWNRIDE